VANLPISLLVPIFVMAGLGALLAKFPWLRPGWQTGATELTAKVLIPALLLHSTYQTGLPSSVSWQLLSAFYLPLIALFLVAAYGLRQKSAGAATALASTYSNTVFVGLPVLIHVLGKDSLQFAYPVIAFHSLVCFTLYYLTSANETTGSNRWVKSFATAFTNPIVLSLFLGLVLHFSGIVLPQVVTKVLEMLSAAALPCALLALGASLASLQIRRWTKVLAVVATKLVVLPLAVMALAVYAFALPTGASKVLVLLASCPVGVNAAFVIDGANEDTQLINSSILLSSLACAVTIPLWMWLLKLT
jgi:malonate transporter